MILALLFVIKDTSSEELYINIVDETDFKWKVGEEKNEHK